MNKAVLLGGVLIVVAAIGGFFLLQNQSGQSEVLQQATEEQSQQQEQETSSTASTGAAVSGSETTVTESDVVKEFTIEGQPFSFTPNEIRVQQGDRVRITFVNNEGTHDWVLDEFDARTDIIQGGQSDTVEFVADQKGTFEFYCSVGNHRTMGMVGNLIVE